MLRSEDHSDLIQGVLPWISVEKTVFPGISVNLYEGLEKMHIREIKYGMGSDPLSSGTSSSSKDNY